MQGKLFSLFKRDSIWYVQFKKPNNTYTTARTTRKRSKIEAERFAIEYLQKGNLVLNERVTFATFAGDFFNWNREWALDKRARGLCLSEHHCQTLGRTFKKWVLPVFGECRLVQVDRAAIKVFRNQLYEKGLAGHTINFILSTIKSVLEDAEEKGLIRGVPKIDRVANRSKSKGILTIEEVRRLFSIKWDDYRVYAASVLACTTDSASERSSGLCCPISILKRGVFSAGVPGIICFAYLIRRQRPGGPGMCSYHSMWLTF